MTACWNDIADTFRRRARRMVGVRGLAWVGIVVVGLLWGAGLLDWALHLNNSWIRLVMGLGILAAVGVTVWRTLWRPLTVRLSDVEIARTIERCHPQWNDRLSSAAQFRTADRDQRHGSRDLQQSLIADVNARLSDLEVERIFETQPIRRLVASATVVCFLGAVAVLWQPAAAATALSRIAMPFANIQWPRMTRLQFLDADLRRLDDKPLRTAAGVPIALYLENRLGPLPDDVLLQLRLPNGRSEERTLQFAVLRDESGASHEVGVFSFAAHEGPVEFRASGGDDLAMAWRTLDVMPAPALVGVTIRVTPPDYVVQPPRTLDGAGTIEALVGSRVRFEGIANKPLASVKLRREGQPPLTMTLSDDRRTVATEFSVNQAGQTWFWFDLTDEYGLEQSDAPRYELRAVADRKPTVYIDQPAGDITVTPDADVMLCIIARDDLGIAAMSLVHSKREDPPARLPLEMLPELPTDQSLEWIWNLASLELTPGDRLTYYAEAIDACDLPAPSQEDRIRNSPESPLTETSAGAGQVGVSAHRHIDVLSAEVKRHELAARQLGVLDALQALHSRQVRALGTTAELRIQSELVERLQPDDLDLLKQTELQQQQIRDQLEDPHSGVNSELQSLQFELARNRIDDPLMAERLAQLASELAALTDEVLPAAEHSLARARKFSQASGAASEQRPEPILEKLDSKPQQLLRQAEQAQTAALAILEDATDRLGGWRERYEVTSELDSLITDQQDVQHETQHLGRETLTQRSDQLSTQQQADLARLSDRQRRLATRLDQLLSRGTQEEGDLSEDEVTKKLSAHVDALREALQKLTQRNTLSQMHAAAEALKRNDIPLTTEAQQQVLEDLRDFGNLLQLAEEDTVETLLSKLEEHSQQVETLRKRQQQLAREAQRALGPTADPDRQHQLQRLIKEQAQLAEQAEHLSRQLRRQQNNRGAQSAARAGRRMREAQQGIEQQQPRETAERQQEALDDLMQLANELVERRAQIERQLVEQQIQQLADELQELADRQQSVMESTVDLDTRQRERGSWSRTLRKDLRSVTDAQGNLVASLNERRDRLTEYPVIDLALEQAAVPMRDAAQRLERSDVGEATVVRQRTAHQKLSALIEATRQAQEEQASTPSGPAADQDRQGPTGSQQSKLLGTQLRLLRQLQVDVQQRTKELTSRLGDATVTDGNVDAQRQSLARDQARIAHLTRVLLEEFSGPPPTTHDMPRDQERPQ